MKQSLRKLISSLLTVSTSLVLTGLGLANTAYAAGQLTQTTVTMSDVRSAVSSNYIISFRAGSTNSVSKVVFKFRQNASADETVPGSFSVAASSKNAVSVGGSSDTGNWTLDKSVAGQLTYTATTPTGSLTGSPTGTQLIFTTDGLVNPSTSAGSPCDSVTDSDTCWVRIVTYANDGTTVVDTATTTFTVINPITVTATVDPILTFTVAGTSSSTTPDAGAGLTSVTTTATTVPFGNVTLGSAKTATQSLTVLTNANNGYTVYNKYLGTTPSTDLMTGTYSGNNIDPFASVTGTGWVEDGGGNAPGDWTTPTGTTKNVDTAWLGMRTNNTGVSGFSSGKWSPPYVGTAVGKKVMVSAVPDNGGTPTYVSYKIQANAYQPSDSYTGTTVYNVVASY